MSLPYYYLRVLCCSAGHVQIEMISFTMFTLASTPDSEYGRTRSVRNKENIPANNGMWLSQNLSFLSPLVLCVWGGDFDTDCVNSHFVLEEQ